LLFAKNSVAVHWCWVTAQLYEQYVFIGVCAVTHLLATCLEQQHWTVVIAFAKNSVAVH